MSKVNRIKNILSFFGEIPLKKYLSKHSGELYITLLRGKKVLNTARVNYSFNSLHRVFSIAFKRSELEAAKIRQTLILGLGGGSIIEILRKDYALSTPITVVEIDPVIIEIAREEFGIDRYAPLEILEKDALDYMKDVSATFDLICIDLFIHELVPDPFLETGFLQKLIATTNKGGRIYFNIMLSDASIRSKLVSLMDFLDACRGRDIVDVCIYEIEENNQVVVITK